ncbi:MAG: AsmA family protein [Alphaproteobacteria bacterium]|nr:AsmA family protein [Alphaproteobacteria bacterium]
MRKLLTGLLGLIVIFIAAALVVPSFIDWNEYKGAIASQAKKATGRDVFIGGDLKLSVFPTPALSVRDLHLANVEGAVEPDMVSLKALTVRVALRPLFEGEVEVESISLVEPVIHLEVLKNGLNNWTFAALETSTGEEMDPTIPAAKDGDSGAGPGADSGTDSGSSPDVMVTLNHFAIENGTLSYRDAGSGTFEKIAGLNADITAKSLQGPFEAEGDMVTHGLPLSFSARVGPLDPARPLPVILEAGLDPAGVTARITGSLSKLSAEGEFTGTLKVTGDDLGEAISFSAPGAMPALPGFLAQAVTVEGTLSASAEKLGVNDLSLQLGDIKAGGAVTVALSPSPRVAGALHFGRIDLDEWLAMASTKAKPASGDGEKRGKESSAATGTKGDKGDKKKASSDSGFALPSGVAASLNLSTEVLVYNGKVIREAVVEAGLEKGQLSVRKATAQLPGGTSYALSGTLGASKGQPVFAGSFKAASKNLRALLDWLKIDAGGVPADRLRGLSLSGQVAGSRQQVNVTNLAIRLDATKMTGGLVIALRERPAFGLSLDLDRLNLNAYLPVAGDAGKGAAKGLEAVSKARGDIGGDAGAKKPAPLKSNGKGSPGALAALGGFDANFKITAGILDYNKTAIKGARLDGTIQGGKLTLHDAGISDLAGAGIKVTGSLDKLDSAPQVNLGFDLKTKNIPALFRLGGAEPPDYASRMGALGFAGKLTGSFSSVRIDAGLDLAGAKATLAGVVEDTILNPKINMIVDASHSSVVKLARVFAPDYRPAAVKLGGFSFRGQVHGDANRLTLSNMDSKVGPVALAGEAQIALGGARPHVTATLSGSEIVTDLFLPAASKSLGLAPEWRAGPVLAATKGKKRAPPAPSVPWSRAPLDLSGLTAFDADIKLAAAALAYDKYRVDQPQLVMNLKESVLTVSQLSGKMFEGDFNMQSQLVAAAVPTLTSNISVANADIKQALFTAGDIDVADGRLQFTLNTATSGRSSLEMISALSGKGVMKVTEGVVDGFNLTAVSERLKKLDNAMGFLSLLQSSMSGGQTRFSRLDGTFNIEKGVVRTDDILLLAHAGEGRATGIIDLPRWVLDIKANFFLTEHPKAPPFGMHLSGSIDQPKRVFDIERMQAYLLQRGVGSLLRKVIPKKEGEGGAGEILDKILGGGGATQTAPAPTEGQTAPAPAPTQQPETVDPLKEPEKALKGILKGIFK